MDDLEVEEEKLIERVISVNRVAKVVKGGRRFSFSAMVVVGDGKGRIGIGLGKAREVPIAISKGASIAKKGLITIPLNGTTLPYTIIGRFGRSKVLLRPASSGTGIIASPLVRAVMQVLGVRDVLTKSLGNDNPINVAYAVIEGLKEMVYLQKKERLKEAG